MLLLLNALAVVFAVYLALFLVKLPQLWRMIGASTDKLMMDPTYPGGMNRNASVAIGLILAFFTLGSRLREEGWEFFKPYIKSDFNNMRSSRQVKK